MQAFDLNHCIPIETSACEYNSYLHHLMLRLIFINSHQTSSLIEILSKHSIYYYQITQKTDKKGPQSILLHLYQL